MYCTGEPSTAHKATLSGLEAASLGAGDLYLSGAGWLARLSILTQARLKGKFPSSLLSAGPSMSARTTVTQQAKGKVGRQCQDTDSQPVFGSGADSPCCSRGSSPESGSSCCSGLDVYSILLPYFHYCHLCVSLSTAKSGHFCLPTIPTQVLETCLRV